MAQEKTEVDALRDALFMNRKHSANFVDEAELQKAMDFAEDYKKFLNDNKTEREVAKFVVAEAEKKGFVPFDKFKKYAPGDRVYYLNRKRRSFLPLLAKRASERA